MYNAITEERGRRISPCNQEWSTDPSKRVEWCASRPRAPLPRHRPVKRVNQRPRIRANRSRNGSIRGRNTYHCEVLERTCLLDVLQSLLQVDQFLVNKTLCLLRIFDSLHLECLDGLDLLRDIVCGGLEVLHGLLDFVDHGLVLEHTSVLCKVHCLGLLGELLNLSTGGIVSLFEVRKSCGGLTLETELRTDLGPIDLQGGGALWVNCSQ